MSEWMRRSPGVKLRILVDGDQVMLIEAELDAGAVVATHQHIHEQITYLLDGEVNFTIGAEEKRLQPGGSVHLPSNMPHQVVALTRSRVLDVFSPPREDFRPAAAVPIPATADAQSAAARSPLPGGEWYGLDKPKTQTVRVSASVDAQAIRDDYKEGLWLGKKGDVSGDPMYFREAIVFFERVIQYAGEDPAYVEVYNAMAACYRRLGDRVMYEAYKAEYDKRRAEIPS
jgi:quercetin dioxygenase-like cupin family protein